MKKPIAIITIFFALLLLFSSCKFTFPSNNETKHKNDSETGSPDDTTIIKNPDLLYLFLGGVTNYVIIRPENASAGVVSAASKFYSELLKISSVSGLTYTTDYYKDKGDISAYEILIGDTNRTETQDCKKELVEINGDTFVIEVVGQKIVIYGTNDINTALAIDYFYENYVLTNDNNFMNLTVFKYLYHQGLIYPFMPSSMISSASSFTTTVKSVMNIPMDGDFKVLQGGCTDGDYIYCMLENQTVSPTQSMIVRINPKTWTILEKSEIFGTDHSNDMTYNSKTKELIVVHNAPNYKSISIFDVNTLRYKRTVTLTINIYAISYDEFNDRYVVGLSGTYNHAYLDADFRVTRTIIGKDTGNIKQGVDSDDKYIYFVMYKTNTINVYSWEGDYVTEIQLDGITVEPENIFHIGSQIYVACYVSGNGGRIYKVDLVPKS